MQALGRKFLASAALAQNQDGPVYGGKEGKVVQGGCQRRGLPNHILGSIAHSVENTLLGYKKPLTTVKKTIFG